MQRCVSYCSYSCHGSTKSRQDSSCKMRVCDLVSGVPKVPGRAGLHRDREAQAHTDPSVHLRPGFSTGSATAGSSHHQGEEDPCQVEQAIYSVHGGWAHPRWGILSFPQLEPDLKEGPVLKVEKGRNCSIKYTKMWFSSLCISNVESEQGARTCKLSMICWF